MDLSTFKLRSVLPTEYVDQVETVAPGFTALAIAIQSSTVYAQLAKRYKRPGVLPFGQGAPTLLASGTSPPSATLNGRPTMGALRMVLQITTGGSLGTAIFRWSSDGGVTWTSSVTTGSNLVLGSTGMTVTFSAGTYSTDNVYQAPPPCPELFLGWVTILVSADVMRRRGLNTNDPAIVMLLDEAKRVRDEVQQASNSQSGLWDLPPVDDEQSAISAGGPLYYTETSPYVYSDIQEREGRWEDVHACGQSNGLGGRR